MFEWLRRWLREPEMPAHYIGPYRVFTTKYDRITTSDELAAILLESPDLRHFDPPDFEGADREAAQWYEQSAANLVADLSGHTGDVAVTLLLDHSGSTRGPKSCLTAITAGVLAECFHRLGIPHEVLGFTTTSWRGGRSAIDWLATRKPPQPGRLCDLLHIVHRDFGETESIFWAVLERMTNPYLLKENVDAEAILWAVERMQKRSEGRKIVLVISDGAPVDDATMLANGPNILDDHLKSTTSMIIRDASVELYGIGIEYRMWRYYPQYFVISSVADVGQIAVPCVQAILASRALPPHHNQAPH